MPIMPPYKQ